MKLQVVKVDMNGFLGRDFHPEESDQGDIVHVSRVFSESYFRGERIDVMRIPFAMVRDAEYDVVVCYDCFMADGTRRVYLEHEVVRSIDSEDGDFERGE